MAAGGGGLANSSFCRGKVCGWVDGLGDMTVSGLIEDVMMMMMMMTKVGV